MVKNSDSGRDGRVSRAGAKAILAGVAKKPGARMSRAESIASTGAKVARPNVTKAASSAKFVKPGQSASTGAKFIKARKPTY